MLDINQKNLEEWRKNVRIRTFLREKEGLRNTHEDLFDSFKADCKYTEEELKKLKSNILTALDYNFVLGFFNSNFIVLVDDKHDHEAVRQYILTPKGETQVSEDIKEVVQKNLEKLNDEEKTTLKDINMSVAIYSKPFLLENQTQETLNCISVLEKFGFVKKSSFYDKDASKNIDNAYTTYLGTIAINQITNQKQSEQQK